MEEESVAPHLCASIEQLGRLWVSTGGESFRVLTGPDFEGLPADPEEKGESTTRNRNRLPVAVQDGGVNLDYKRTGGEDKTSRRKKITDQWTPAGS